MHQFVECAVVLAVATTVTSWVTTANTTDDRNSTSTGGIQCTTSTAGVSYSVQHDNLSGKSVLKILVEDDYNVTLPPAPTTSSPLKVSTQTAESPTEETTSPEYEPVTNREFIFGDSWEEITDESNDYLEEKIFRRILEREKERHRKVEGPQSWEEFCREAAEEDEEIVQVADGAFHPRYEEVAGVGVYRLHARARSWAEARRVCEREGAQLAVPNSHEEALTLARIHNRCPRLLSSHFNDYQYLGVHDNYNESRWETVVGYPLEETGYVNWAFNQPDNAHHEGENCLSMNRRATFNDVPCWVELPFICEHV